MSFLGYFLLWTFCLYWIHRIGHDISWVNYFHSDHHVFINIHQPPTWHWSNLFLFNDTWHSTIDLWITEVVPTLVFSWVTGQWWISIFYYFWAALVQERIEHNTKLSLYPWLPSGQWHLLHHQNTSKNFGPFVIVWDKLFGTAKDA